MISELLDRLARLCAGEVAAMTKKNIAMKKMIFVCMVEVSVRWFCFLFKGKNKQDLHPFH